MLGKWMETRDYVVIGLIESNVSAKKGYFLTKNFENYKRFWLSRDVNKKSSGAGLLVRKDWKKHLDQVVRYNEFMIKAVFYFKQLEIVIITVYLSPKDKDKIKLKNPWSGLARIRIKQRYLNTSLTKEIEADVTRPDLYRS
ncbi:26150_t:CDS:2 [Gigaspora rosea]|nr:26150_t:CDS:2 [Gigaspora rosea]